MNDDIAQQLIANVALLSRNVQRLVYAIGAASNKPLLNDPEFATLLGHQKPEKATEWLKDFKKNGHANSVRSGRLRRWKRTEVDRVVAMLESEEQEPVVTRKPRLKKTA